ncbi:MAG: hypothetical protein HC880_02405 [Bacteroidia bacterium]|nr:hypothetical protein [Bacteroidia bacterium]
MMDRKDKMMITAIFDIGKTNKKFFLFDENFEPVKSINETFPEIADDDGFPCEDIQQVIRWMKQVLGNVIHEGIYEVKRLNVSAHGASWMHLDEHGQAVAPLYNYLKDYPSDLMEQFYQQTGGKDVFERETASPSLGMLNSGLQLYWLKHRKPEVFAKIKYSLHLPQYYSWLFSGQLYSEYTSIGCHTGLWDFARQDYHSWVKHQNLTGLFPPICPTDTRFSGAFAGQDMIIGPGFTTVRLL